MEHLISSDGDSGFRWWLRAQDGRLIATCANPLESRAACLIDIGRVKRSQHAPALTAEKPPVSLRESSGKAGP